MADERVLNIRDLGHAASWPADVVRVDRRSKWGNPNPIGRGMSRWRSLRLYRYWLIAQLRIDPAFLEPLRDHRLACWCAPLDCHAEIILEALADGLALRLAGSD